MGGILSHIFRRKLPINKKSTHTYTMDTHTNVFKREKNEPQYI